MRAACASAPAERQSNPAPVNIVPQETAQAIAGLAANAEGCRAASALTRVAGAGDLRLRSEDFGPAALKLADPGEMAKAAPEDLRVW